MSLTSGFYDSYNGDRRYNAEQLSSIFDGIIRDGVFGTIGDQFFVYATSGTTIQVGRGRGWFNHTWVYNDSRITIDAGESDASFDRVDTVVIEIDRSSTVRNASIKVIKGDELDIAGKKPIRGSDINQYVLARITRRARSTEIHQSDIEFMVGRADWCPLVTGPLEMMTIDNIIAQWEAQWSEWLNGTQTATTDRMTKLEAYWQSEFDTMNVREVNRFEELYEETENRSDALIEGKQLEFDDWFNSLRSMLSADAATNLAKEILELKDEILPKIEDSYGNAIGDSDGEVIRSKLLYEYKTI